MLTPTRIFAAAVALGLLVLGGCSTPATPIRVTLPVSPMWPVSASVHSGDGGELRVMSFNLRRPFVLDGANHWPHRKQRVVRFLDQQQADFIGMQECLAGQGDYLLARLPHYDMVGVGRSDGKRGGEMSPIFYRKARFTLLSDGHFWLSRKPQTPGSTSWGAVWTRMVTWAHFLDRHTGEDLFVFNTHFSVTSARARQASARMLTDAIDKIAGPTPVVVTGDFNADADSPTHRLFAQNNLRDTHRLAQPHQRHEPGTRHNYFGGVGGPRIDWVLACDRFDILDAGVLTQPVDGRYVSDHHPVFAVVKARTVPALARAGRSALITPAN